MVPLTMLYPQVSKLGVLVATIRAALLNYKTAPFEMQVKAVSYLHKAVGFIKPNMTESDKQALWYELQKCHTLLEREGNHVQQ